jgi:hypothetical protein
VVRRAYQRSSDAALDADDNLEDVTPLLLAANAQKSVCRPVSSLALAG